MQSSGINVEQDKKTLSLCSDHTQIVFAQDTQGLMLTSLAKADCTNYLKKPTLLWQIEMTSRDKIHANLSQGGIQPTGQET